jgi:hypothetical protein
MFYSPRLYFRDLWISLPLVGVFFIQIYIWYDLIANIHPDMGQIFLHYNIVFGVDLVGDWWRIFLLPGAGLLVLAVNYILSYSFYGSDKFMARLLGLWVLLFHALLLAGTIFLVSMNA